MNLHYHPHILHNLHFGNHFHYSKHKITMMKMSTVDDSANGINTKSSYEFDHSLMSIKRFLLSTCTNSNKVFF